MEAETETQTRKMVLRHGGTPLVTQSGLDRRPECKPHSDAGRGSTSTNLQVYPAKTLGVIARLTLH